jgi:DNA-binding CsgD family transcriptional regulator
MKKGIGILLYLILMAVFLKFDLRFLFDIRQLLLVLFGTILLLLPSVYEKGGEDGKRTKLPRIDKGKLSVRIKHFFGEERERIGQNAVWAGLLQTFVLLFLNMNIVDTEFHGVQTIAISCRPILYGFCIWVIMQESGKEEKHAESDESQENGGIQHKIAPEALGSAVNYRQCLQTLGLTKREVEIALLVIQNETNAEIAEQLFISETTVKKHMSNIFSKLGISQRQEIKEKCMASID